MRGDLGHALTQARHRVPILRRAVFGRWLPRHPELRSGREVEAPRHDADHGITPVAHADGAIPEFRAPQMALPEAVADDRYLPAVIDFVGLEDAPQRR